MPIFILLLNCHYHSNTSARKIYSKKKCIWKLVFFRNLVFSKTDIDLWFFKFVLRKHCYMYFGQLEKTNKNDCQILEMHIFSITPRQILPSAINTGSGSIPIKVRGKFPIDFNSATEGLYRTDREPFYFWVGNTKTWVPKFLIKKKTKPPYGLFNNFFPNKKHKVSLKLLYVWTEGILSF